VLGEKPSFRAAAAKLPVSAIFVWSGARDDAPLTTLHARTDNRALTAQDFYAAMTESVAAATLGRRNETMESEMKMGRVPCRGLDRVRHNSDVARRRHRRGD
jgi:hypothetical protein